MEAGRRGHATPKRAGVSNTALQLDGSRLWRKRWLRLVRCGHDELLSPDTFFAPVGGSDTVSPRGWVGGGQIGYNWQIGGFVVGVEGAWNLPSLNDERAGTFQQFLLGFVGDHWIAEISQLYAITGRLGVANGNWLPYAKGGLAGAKVETSMNRLGDPNFISQSKNWHGGWTIGGGVEYMLAQNFTVELEYNYYNFESKNVSAIRTNDPLGAGVSRQLDRESGQCSNHYGADEL